MYLSLTEFAAPTTILPFLGEGCISKLNTFFGQLGILLLLEIQVHLIRQKNSKLNSKIRFIMY